MSTFFVFMRGINPAIAAAPTIINEEVVAATVESPMTAISPGTASIAPPAPIIPRTSPIKIPRIIPSKSIMN